MSLEVSLAEAALEDVWNHRPITDSDHIQHITSELRFVFLNLVLPLQVQFALAVLDGSVSLPPVAEMEQEVRQDLQEKAERGVLPRHLLIMEQDQWEYCQDLARTAGFAPLRPVVRSLYEEVWRQRRVHPENYRKLNYRVVSDTQWELTD